MSDLITIKLTKAELWELINLIANGVFDDRDPANKVAANASGKLSDAWHKAQRTEAKP